MFPIGLFVIAVITTLLSIMWIIFFIKGKEFENIIKPLSSKEYPLKELYVIGFTILKLINYKFKSRKDQIKLKDIANVYGQRYASYYMRVVYAQKITAAFTVALIFFFLSALAANPMVVIFGIFFAVAVYYYVDLQVKDKIEDKEEELLRDFPEFLSKLTLLINAGMIMRGAWEKVSITGEGRLYTEMQLTINEINNGIPEVEAYANFGTRCGVNEIKKFTSTLVQNLTKGNSELVEYLKQQSKESWENKKHNVRRQGEKASSKLLIPIGIMFIGILIMVLLPVFGNMMNG